MKKYTEEEWLNLARSIYDLVICEIDNPENQNEIDQKLPKIIVGIEFFRLIRGEAFYNSRPYGLEEGQKEMYDMEKDLYQKLDVLKTKVNFVDEKTHYYLDQMKKAFDLS